MHKNLQLACLIEIRIDIGTYKDTDFNNIGHDINQIVFYTALVQATHHKRTHASICYSYCSLIWPPHVCCSDDLLNLLDGDYFDNYCHASLVLVTYQGPLESTDGHLHGYFYFWCPFLYLLVDLLYACCRL